MPFIICVSKSSREITNLDEYDDRIHTHTTQNSIMRAHTTKIFIVSRLVIYKVIRHVNIQSNKTCLKSGHGKALIGCFTKHKHN